MGDRTLIQQISRWGALAGAIIAIVTVGYYVMDYGIRYVGGQEVPYAPKSSVMLIEGKQDKILRFLDSTTDTLVELKLKSCISDKVAALGDLGRNPTSKDAMTDLATAEECIDKINKNH